MTEFEPAGEGADLEIEERFAIVPEWLLDAPVSDAAVRLYAVLLRYGHTSGARMPSRATLAGRLRKKSVDTVDRAMRELVEFGAVQVQPRFVGRERLTNLYRVRTSRPRPPSSEVAVIPQPAPMPEGDRTNGAETGGRKSAATPIPAAGRAAAASPKEVATVAAPMRPNREFSTDSPPPTSSNERPPIAVRCGIDDWSAFVDACLQRRTASGLSTGRWTAHCLDAALQTAVLARSWPATDAPSALLAVAADKASRSPMRVAEAGPWWDSRRPAAPSHHTEEEVLAAEFEIAETGGLRLELQRTARAQLAAEGLPVVRATVVMRAVELLRARDRVSS